MPRPKRHHFVPQWYLERFTDPQSGCLHAYDKTTNKYWTPKPQNIMVIKDYYQQKHVADDIDPDIFEKELAWLEQKAQQGFQKLLNPPLNFSEEDRAHLLTYPALQYIRVPRQAEDAKRTARQTLELHVLQAPSEIVPLEVKAALLKREIAFRIKDGFRFNFMKLVLDEVSLYLSRMVWEVASVDERGSFITSDSPVTLFNRACVPPIDAGFALVGTTVFFPLDSQHVLVLRHPEVLENPSISPLDIVPKPVREEGRIGVAYEVCDEHQVNALNQIMLVLADRVIVGRSKAILEKAVEPILS